MGQAQIYCSICGAPMQEDGFLKGTPREWLANAILLTTAHETENGGLELDAYWPRSSSNPESRYTFYLGPNPPGEARRTVLQLEAHARGEDQFDLLGSGERVDAMRVYIEPKPWDNIRKPVFTSHTPPDDRITSIKQLWEVLYRRLNGTHGFPPRMGTLPEPHDYFGGSLCRGVDWNVEEDPEHGEIHESNPCKIPDLTESLLANLEPISIDDKEATTSNGIQDTTAHQNQWCEALIDKEKFPWLWDLDVNAIREKQQAGQWNWELLVRQLSEASLHEPGNTSLKLPLSLKNRRRIWRLLEEARVNDIAGPEGKAIAARAEARRQRLSTMQSSLEFTPGSGSPGFPLPPFGRAGFPPFSKPDTK